MTAIRMMAVASALALVVLRANASPVAITNPSFETGSYLPWSGQMGGVIVNTETRSEFLYLAPDGTNCIFAYGSTHKTFQVLSETLVAGATYTLQMDFMHGAGTEPCIPSMLVLGYGAGGPSTGTELARIESGDDGAPVPSSAGYLTWTLTFKAGQTGAGEPLWIQFGANGTTSTGRAGYDNIRLDMIPPPPAGTVIVVR